MNKKKRIKKQNKNESRYRTHIIIWLVLVCFSFLIGIVLQFSDNFFQINQNLPISTLHNKVNIPLIKGDKLFGEFRAHNSDMGIVSVRFNTFERSVEDKVVFRLKEKESKAWYYQHTYDTNQFQSDQLFPFGFPPILNSRHRIYQIELESISGEKGDAVALSSVSPSVVAVYQLSPRMMLSEEGVEVLFKKYFQSLVNPDMTLLVLSPFLFYLLVRYVIFRNVRRIIVILIVSITFGYIFLAGKLLPGEQITSNNLEAFIYISWIVIVMFRRVDWKIWVINSFIMELITIIILLILRRPDLASRSSSLSFGFLFIGTIQYIIQRMSNSFFSVSFIEFWTKLLPERLQLRLKNKKAKHK